MANRRISEFSSIEGTDIDQADLLTLVHMIEVDPTLKNKKITFSGFNQYLDQYFLNKSGDTISGDITITGDLAVRGDTNLNTVTITGDVYYGAASDVVMSGTLGVSGLSTLQHASGDLAQFTTIEGNTASLSTSVTAPLIRGTTTVSGATVTGTDGNFTNIQGIDAEITTISGTTITGNTVQATNLVAVTGQVTSVTGTSLTYTTGTFTSVTGTNAQFTTAVIKDVTITGTSIIDSDLTVTGTISGVTVTGTSGIFTSIKAINGEFTTNLSGVTITGQSGLFAQTLKISGEKVASERWAEDQAIVYSLAFGS